MRKLIYLGLFVLLFWGNLTTSLAQDTFGPICEGVGTTCSPSPSPTETPLPTATPDGYVPPTNTPIPTDTPVPTTPPGQGGPEEPTPTLYEAGSTEIVSIIMVASVVLISIGLMGKLALVSPKKS